MKQMSRPDIVKCMASGLKSFPSTIKTLNPDLVIILGDRYEIMPVAISITNTWSASSTHSWRRINSRLL